MGVTRGVYLSGPEDQILGNEILRRLVTGAIKPGEEPSNSLVIRACVRLVIKKQLLQELTFEEV